MLRKKCATRFNFLRTWRVAHESFVAISEGQAIMHSITKLGTVVALAAMTLPSSAYATTVVSQPLASAPVSQYSLLGGQQEFSQFSLGTNTAIMGATFFGRSYTNGALPANFVIQFFSSVSNLPGTELFNSTVSGTSVSTGVNDNVGGDIKAITASFASFTALAGVPYFFGVAAPVGSAYDFVVDSGAGGVGAQGYTPNFYNLNTAEAFSLSADVPASESPVPEPATWALMLLGFGGIGMAMRRQRKPALAQIA